MPTFTTALYEARELAMARMQHEATRLGAVGVVGTQIHESSHGWESHVIEFLSLGTAVVADATMASDAAITLTLGVDR